MLPTIGRSRLTARHRVYAVLSPEGEEIGTVAQLRRGRAALWTARSETGHLLGVRGNKEAALPLFV